MSNNDILKKAGLGKSPLRTLLLITFFSLGRDGKGYQSEGGAAYKEISKLTKEVGISQMKLWEEEAHEERSRSSPSSLAIKTLVGFVVDVISGFNYYILWYEETTASRFLHSSNKI